MINVHPLLINIRPFLIHVHFFSYLNKNKLITLLYFSDINQEANNIQQIYQRQIFTFSLLSIESP